MSTSAASLVEPAPFAGYVVPAPTAGDVLRGALRHAFGTGACDQVPFHDILRHIDEVDRSRG